MKSWVRGGSGLLEMNSREPKRKELLKRWIKERLFKVTRGDVSIERQRRKKQRDGACEEIGLKKDQQQLEN